MFVSGRLADVFYDHRDMKIIPLSIPTPFYVGDVNVYLIREDPLTLIDVGPKTKEATDALRKKLAAEGVKFSDIRRIVLTHAHEDHCGLAKQVRDEANDAEILVHEWETGHLFGRLAHEEHRKLMLRSGVPDPVFDEMKTLYEEISLLTDSLEDADFRPCGMKWNWSLHPGPCGSCIPRGIRRVPAPLSVKQTERLSAATVS